MVNVYSVIVFASGLMALGFQLGGTLRKEWLVMSTKMAVNTPSVNTSVESKMTVSLFSIGGCGDVINNGVKVHNCTSMSKKDFVKNAMADTNSSEVGVIMGLFDDFDVLPYIMISALLTSLLGIVVFSLQYSSCCAKAKIRVELGSLFFWLASVALLISAVAMGGHLNTSLSRLFSMVSKIIEASPAPPGYSMTYHIDFGFPWAIFLTGIGMGLCFVCLVAIIIDICVVKFKRSTNYWQYGTVKLDDAHQSAELLRDSD